MPPHNKAYFGSSSAIVPQEVTPYFLLGGLFGLNVRPASFTDMSVVTRQHYREAERAENPSPVLRAGVQGPNVSPPTDQRSIVRQEAPFHPLPHRNVGVQGPNVRPPVIFTATYQPEVHRRYRGETFARPGVQGPDVRPPTTNVVVVREVAASPLYSHPRPTWQVSVQGPNVETKVVDAVQLRQQLPDHPLPRAAAGPFGLNVAPPVVRVTLVYQAQPDLGRTATAAGVQGPDVRPTEDVVFLRQQQPDHPSPTGLPGIQGPNVRPLEDLVLLRQHQPDLGRFSLLPGDSLLVPQQPVPPTTALTVTIQRLPDNPSPSVVSGVLGVDVRPTEDTAVTRLEQPENLQAVLRAGVPGGPVLTKVADYAVVVNYGPPVQPAPLVTYYFEVPRPTLPLGDGAVTRQEAPRREGLVTEGGVPPLATPPLAAAQLFLRQPRPDHPSVSFVSPGLQGPNTAPFAYEVFLREAEEPSRQPASLDAGILGPDVRSPTDAAISVVQEAPRAAFAVFYAGVAGPDVLFPPVPFGAFMHQEQPGHPMPVTFVNSLSYGQVLRRVVLRFSHMSITAVVNDSLEPS